MRHKCSKHKYYGKGKPKHKKCEECLLLWARIIVSEHRRSHKPTKVIPSKKIYTRKIKHK